MRLRTRTTTRRDQKMATTVGGAVMFGDLETPGGLLAAAASVARVHGRHKELIMMATGPDLNSVAVTNTSLVSIAALGLRKHVLLIADSHETCRTVLAHPGPCFWSSRMPINKPADSLTIRQFWDFRFRCETPPTQATNAHVHTRVPHAHTHARRHAERRSQAPCLPLPRLTHSLSYTAPRRIRGTW